MQNQTLKETLGSVICRVLEQAAFMFPEPADMEEGISFDEYEYNIARIAFEGDKSGEIILIVPVEFRAELAANMLGEEIEESDSKGKHADALREILNIIAGQLLTTLYGEKAIFNLMPPVVSELPQEEFFSLIEKNDYTCVISDEYPVISYCTLNEESNERSGISS